MSARLLVGTSGFSFDAWKGPFYPADIKPKAMLAYYASRLSSVEINYTFRHHPSASTLAGWRAQTPEGFAFAVKAHQRITHTGRLKVPADAVSFVARVRELGERLGPVLLQCPPNLKHDDERLEGLLGALAEAFGTGADAPRLAFEFRHRSWLEAKPRLLAAGASLVISETDEEPFAPDGAIDPGRFAYLRLRREAYDDEAIARWAGRIAAALSRGTEVYCYFKHEDDGLGPALAERLREAVLRG